MIEPNNCWEGIVNGVNSEEFANILNILDFPMESLEGDGGVGDLEPHNFQSMGPIPLDSLAGVPLVSQSRFDCVPEVKGSIRNAPVNIKSERIDPTYRGIYNNGSNAPSPVSILENGGSCSSVKCSITKPKISIPGRIRSKRKRPSNLHSWFRTSPIICSGYNNKDFNKQKLTRTSDVSAGLSKGFYAIKKKATILDEQSLSTKKCTHCQVSKTPQWREGPLGPKTLCNACGVRYRSGRLLPEYRPASSPTFVPSFHSNSHRKVLQMRMKATQHDIEAPPMSPPPEFVPRSNQSVRSL